jgi:hypothetical protein
MFREEVAEGRAMRPSSLRKLKGAAVFGEQAVKAHLADRLVDSWEKFLGEDSSSAHSHAQAKKEEMNMGLYSKAAMQKAAAEGDEDAKAALALMAKAEDDGDMESCGDCGKKHGKKAKCKAEDKEEYSKKAKAKEDAPIKKDDEKDESKALQTVIAKVQAMEKAAADKEAKALEDVERAKLLAERPDFSDAVLEVLALAPLDALRKAVKDFPKSEFRNPNANALKAHGTPGSEANAFNPPLSKEVQEALDKHMPIGGRAEIPFQVGCGDVEAARKFLARQEEARKATLNGKGV